MFRSNSKSCKTCPGQKPARNLETGKWGEGQACAFLLSLGYELLQKNWHGCHLEIDLIFRDADVIVFVEVKTRSSEMYGGASGAVGKSKRRHLVQAASAWLLANDLWESPCRFDVVCLTGKRGNFKLEHYKNAFDAGQTVDCGNPPG